ncbi:DNA-binding protein [Bacterioplanoides sp.]|uniref:DNA-binding protein n=1 Tax=Bacterioplanoides sp. TaxID=2066072 RepID=UPI003B59AE7F
MIEQKLMPLRDWREQRFVGTPPSVSTVKRWVKNGDIPTKKIGGSIFVILNEEMNTTGDHLVDAVLSS